MIKAFLMQITYIFCYTLAHLSLTIFEFQEKRNSPPATTNFKIVSANCHVGQRSQRPICLPNIVNSPDMVQTTMDMLTLPVEASTPVGEMKIPLPMIQPTMTLQPFKRVISAFSFNSGS